MLPCERWPRGLGLAFKIEDGDREDRARPVAAVAALRQLGVVDDDTAAALESVTHPEVKNKRGERVGEVRAAFELRRESHV